MFSSSLRAGMMMEMEGASVDFFGEGLNHPGRPRMSHNAGAQRMATPGKTSKKALIDLSGDRVTLANAVGAVLPGENHHGHAAARVGAAAGEVEVAVLGGGLGSFESVVLFPVGDDAVNRPLVRAIHALDVDGSEEIFGHDGVAQSGEAAAFHLVDTAFFEGNVVLVSDAGVVSERGDVRKDFDVVASLGCFVGIGTGWSDDVEGRVVGELLFMEDGLEVFVLVLGVEEIVVGELGKDAVGSEVEDDAGAGRGKLLELSGEGGWFVEEFFVGRDHFHIADDDVGGVDSIVGEADAGDGFAGFFDGPDIGAEVHRDVHFLHQLAEADGEVVHAAADIPETVVELDDRHEVHVAGGVECGGADILDEVFEDEAHLGVAEALVNRLGHRVFIVDGAGEELQVVVFEEFPK